MIAIFAYFFEVVVLTAGAYALLGVHGALDGRFFEPKRCF